MQSKYMLYTIAFLLFFLQLAVNGLVYKLLKYIDVLPVLILGFILSFLPFCLVLYILYKEPPKIEKPLDSKTIEEVIKDNIWVFYFIPLLFLYFVLYVRGDTFKFFKWLTGIFIEDFDEQIIIWNIINDVNISAILLFFSILGIVKYVKNKYTLKEKDKKLIPLASILMFLFSIGIFYYYAVDYAKDLKTFYRNRLTLYKPCTIEDIRTTGRKSRRYYIKCKGIDELELIVPFFVKPSILICGLKRNCNIYKGQNVLLLRSIHKEEVYLVKLLN